MSYINNPRQYVEDLSAAAEAEDWEMYQRVQSQLAVESTLSALQQVQQTVQPTEKHRKNALGEMGNQASGRCSATGTRQKRFGKKTAKVGQSHHLCRAE
jgi:hypothetical protein